VMPTVLLVEDDIDYRILLVHSLQAVGYSCITASNGLEALQKAREGSPDLVLLDLGLPGMDGREVCRLLRQRSSVPIIILTGWPDEAVENELLALGADDFMRKTVTLDVLLAHTEAALRTSGARQEAGKASSPRFPS